MLIDTVLLIARLALAGVFSVAGLGKLADRAGSRRALIDFGVPAVLATGLGILLPLMELGLAVALLPAATAWWAAGGILVLLALFVGGIGIHLARGRRPACHCFGQLSSGPIGWKTIARDLVLGALAGSVVWQGTEGVGPSAFEWMGKLTVTEGLMLGFGVLGLAAARPDDSARHRAKGQSSTDMTITTTTTTDSDATDAKAPATTN